ncbi:thioredoxin family protein [Streptomyces sp. NPDC006879]|uniref:thioredoxin family protein n=1 Tax=Streptomyces sp. NPDC006879 TaxID=3364767 RepID=UPI00367D8A87
MASRVHQPREDAEFDFILRHADGPVLAYFIGVWPKAVEVCRVVDPVVREVAEEYRSRLTVIRADMARCPEPTRRYGVTAAPTVVLLVEGAAVATITGAIGRTELDALVAAHL